MSVELAEAYVSLIPSARGMGAGIAAEMSGPAAAAGKTAGTTAAASYAGALTAGLAAAAGAIAVGVAAFKIGESFDAEFDKIRVGTGATGEALEELEGSFKNVLRNVPASFGDAGTAIADLNTRLGLTGRPLEALSGQFINLSRITGTELAGNVDNITRVFGDWGIETGNQAEAMDQIYRAAQSSGIGIDNLSSSVVQFGAPLRNLGFGFDESLALLAQFNKTGVNTETVFAGLKVGVGTLAKAGESVPETFRRIVDEITALGPGSEATGLAIELFGQRAGPDLADAIAGGKFEIEDMLGAITDGSDTINGAAKDTEDFGQKWLMFKNRILVGLEPLATKVFDGMGAAMDIIGPKIESIIKWGKEIVSYFTGGFNGMWENEGEGILLWANKAGMAARDFIGVMKKIRDAIADVFDWMKNNKDEVIGALIGVGVAAATVLVPAFIGWATAAASAAAATLIAAAPFVLIGAAVAALGAALVYAYQNVDWFRTAVDAVASFFTGTVIPAVKAFVGAVVSVVTEVVNFIRTNWDTIKTIITTAFDAVAAYVSIVWTTISGVIEGAINVVRGIIQTVTSLISGDWSGAWEGIKRIVSGVWQAITTVINGAISGVRAYLAGVMGAISGAWSTVWRGIADRVSSIWSSITGYVSRGIGEVVSFVRGLPGRVASAIGSGFSSIWEKFRDVINRIIRTWNNLSFQFPSFDGDWNGPLPGGNFTVGGWTINTPNLPEFHNGIDRVPGNIGDEMIAVLEAGERVIPASENNALGAGGAITLIIEGRPFSAMIAEHERGQVAELMAGVR